MGAKTHWSWLNVSKLLGLFVMNRPGLCGIPARGIEFFFLSSSYCGPGYRVISMSLVISGSKSQVNMFNFPFSLVWLISPTGRIITT